MQGALGTLSTKAFSVWQDPSFGLVVCLIKLLKKE